MREQYREGGTNLRDIFFPLMHLTSPIRFSRSVIIVTIIIMNRMMIKYRRETTFSFLQRCSELEKKETTLEQATKGLCHFCLKKSNNRKKMD